MPQLILEYSDNIIETGQFSHLLQKCHKSLVEILPTDLASCKSRIIECKSYVIGDGQANNAFIHVSLKVMPGRPQNILQSIGQEILEIMSNHFNESLCKLNLQITLEVSELQSTYFKIISESK